MIDFLHIFYIVQEMLRESTAHPQTLPLSLPPSLAPHPHQITVLQQLLKIYCMTMTGVIQDVKAEAMR